MNHGLPESTVVTDNNKFALVASKLGVTLRGKPFTPTKSSEESAYWKYDVTTEKHASILFSLETQASANGTEIYANHGGTERSYLILPDGSSHTVPKYVDREAYKSGDKEKGTLRIPDTVIRIDGDEPTIIMIEGKRYATRSQGVIELEKLNGFEDLLKTHYPNHKVIKGLTLFGGNVDSTKLFRDYPDVLLYVNEKGNSFYNPLMKRFFNSSSK